MLDIITYLFLITGLLMLAGRSITNNITLLALQSLFLSLIAFDIGFSGSSINWHMAAVGGLTLGLKVLILPQVLYKLVQKVKINRESSPSVGLVPSILIGVSLIGLTYAYVVPVLLKEIHQEGQLLPVSLAAVLLGCFFMISRSSALNQLIGIVAMENGLFLCALAVTGGMPLIIELGIFFDVLVGALVMGIITYQIKGVFETVDTKVLNKLKG